MNGHTAKFNRELAKLEGRDFMEMYLKALQYFKPQLSKQEVKQENVGPTTIKVEYVDNKG